MSLSSLGPTTIRLLGVLGVVAACFGAGAPAAMAQTGSPPEVTVDVAVLDALGPAKHNGDVTLHPPRRHGEAAAPHHRERRAATRRARHRGERRVATRHARTPKRAASPDLAVATPAPAEMHREAPVAAAAPVARSAPARNAEAARIQRAEAAKLRQARAEIDAASRQSAAGDSLGPIRNAGPGPSTPPKPVATSLAPINAAPDLTAGVSPRTAPASSSPAQQTAAVPAPTTDAAAPAPAAAAASPLSAPESAPAPAPKPTKMAAALPLAVTKAPPPATAAPARPAAVEAGPAAAAHIDFAAGTADLGAAARTELDGLAKTLAADQNKRVQLVAYATGSADEANQARRLSLSRALNVRAYLIDHGVRNTRMDVRALGNRDDGAAPADRVDIVMLDSK
jgi:outer membrane protein OmpA-like peptidoglycan-associated protein